MTILLIEDNNEIRENTAELLVLANYTVLTAGNGKVGIELAQKKLPDVIVCDIMMPELDGYGVLHILSRSPQTANIPFIFLTAKSETTDIRKGMNLGADDYLTKPFDETELLNAIESRLKKHRIRKRSYENTTEGLTSFVADAGEALNLRNLCQDRQIKKIRKKSDVFSEGDIPLHIYFLNKGSVKAYRSHPDGKEFIVSLYKDGDYFGYESLLANKAYIESATALEDSEIISIPKQDFLTFMENSHDIASAFISLLCNKVLEKENQLLSLAYNSLRQRTAEALLKIKFLNKEKPSINTSRDDIARIVGTAAESVTRILSEFKDEGLIEIESGKIVLAGTEGLENVVRWNVSR
jgi:CRP-like cAMP-binding protein/CheY-like chemotaxis protein